MISSVITGVCWTRSATSAGLDGIRLIKQKQTNEMASSSGIAIGTAKPQTTSSKIGALAGMIFRFVSSSAQIKAMMAPLILLAHA